MTDNAHDIVEFLRREIPTRVHDYFPDLSGDLSIEMPYKGRPLARKHSVLFEISIVDQCTSITRGLFVKIPKRDSEEAVKRIYENMLTLYEFSIQLPEELNVVRPLDYFSELRAIVTERVDGKRLKDLLRNRKEAVDHGEILKNCGRFLHAYHEGLGQMNWQVDFAGEFLDQCKAYLRLLEEHGVGKEERLQIFSAFEQGVRRLRQAVPICLTDRNYTIQNIIIQKNRIFFVDVTEPSRKTIYDDLAVFLDSLTMLSWGTRWFFLNTVPPPAFSKRFLEGYFDDAIPLDLISLFCAKNLCRLWLRAFKRFSGQAGGITDIMFSAPRKHRINHFFYRQVKDHLQAVRM